MAQSPNNQKPNPKKTSHEWFPGPIVLWIFLFLAIFYFAHLGSLPLEKQSKQLTYSEFYSMLEANPTHPTLKTGIRVANEVSGDFLSGDKYKVTLPDNDPDVERLLRQNLQNYDIRPEKTFWIQLY